MLTLHTSGHSRTCEGLTRRDWLRIGTLGLGGLALPDLLRAKAVASGKPDFVRDKAVVLLFLGGGPSHIETFNPNMDAPAPFRSLTGEVKTNLPGVTFGGTFPLLAGHADKMVIVRSFHHGHSNHSLAVPYMLSGGDVFPGGMGAVYARLRGTNEEASGLPTTSLVTAPDVGRFLNPKKRIVQGSQPGELGTAYAPFNPEGGGPAIDNMTLNISQDRLADRQALLGRLDNLKRQIDVDGALDGVDRFRQQAYDMITGAAGEAFDLSKEDPRLVDRYDTGRFRVGEKPEDVRPCTLGRQLLLARRLVERGCGFVTVQNSGWDMHGGKGNNFMTLPQGMEMLGRPLDRAVSAFLGDLSDRGMLEHTLLVITGEFGRTPQVNKKGGRDHWGNLSTLALAGGGLRTGRVYGRAARNNDVPHRDPVGPENLMATIMNVLFDLGQLRLEAGYPKHLLDPIFNHPPIDLAGVY